VPLRKTILPMLDSPYIYSYGDSLFCSEIHLHVPLPRNTIRIASLLFKTHRNVSLLSVLKTQFLVSLLLLLLFHQHVNELLCSTVTQVPQNPDGSS